MARIWLMRALGYVAHDCLNDDRTMLSGFLCAAATESVQRAAWWSGEGGGCVRCAETRFALFWAQAPGANEETKTVTNICSYGTAARSIYQCAARCDVCPLHPPHSHP